MRLVRPALVVLAFFVACDRAPAEPIATATATAKQKARCMRPTSDKEPPAVAKGPDPACPKDPDGKPPEVPHGKVTFSAASGAPSIDVELMLTEANRERGLMYRTSMADDAGMLFVFNDVDVRNFWMKNTCIPLDMLFVAEDGFVTGILENVPTMNEAGRSIPCPVKYVLEVNAGWARRHGVKAGQMVKIDGIP